MIWQAASYTLIIVLFIAWLAAGELIWRGYQRRRRRRLDKPVYRGLNRQNWLS